MPVTVLTMACTARRLRVASPSMSWTISSRNSLERVTERYPLCSLTLTISVSELMRALYSYCVSFGPSIRAWMAISSRVFSAVTVNSCSTAASRSSAM